jgi:hypothetical protein
LVLDPGADYNASDDFKGLTADAPGNLNHLTVLLNGRPVPFGRPPQRAGNEIMVDAKNLLAALGERAEVSGGVLTGEPLSVKITEGESAFVLDGEAVPLPRAPYRQGDVLYVPLHAVAEALGCDAAPPAARHVLITRKALAVIPKLPGWQAELEQAEANATDMIRLYDEYGKVDLGYTLAVQKNSILIKSILAFKNLKSTLTTVTKSALKWEIPVPVQRSFNNSQYDNRAKYHAGLMVLSQHALAVAQGYLHQFEEQVARFDKKKPIEITDADAEIMELLYKKTIAYYYPALTLLDPIKDDLQQYDGKGTLALCYNAFEETIVNIALSFITLGLYSGDTTEQEAKRWADIQPVIEGYDILALEQCIQAGDRLFNTQGGGIVADAEKQFAALTPALQ